MTVIRSKWAGISYDTETTKIWYKKQPDWQKRLNDFYSWLEAKHTIPVINNITAEMYT